MSRRPDIIRLDVCEIDSEGDLIDYLQMSLEFPNLYGDTWRGIEQNFFYDPEMNLPRALHITGLVKMREMHQKLAEKFEIFLKGQTDIKIVFKD